MTDLQAALTEALIAAGCQARVGEPCSDPIGHHAAAILAHPAMADLARKAAAWDALLDPAAWTEAGLLDAYLNIRGVEDEAEASRMLTDDMADLFADALAAASPEEQGDQ